MYLSNYLPGTYEVTVNGSAELERSTKTIGTINYNIRDLNTNNNTQPIRITLAEGELKKSSFLAFCHGRNKGQKRKIDLLSLEPVISFGGLTTKKKVILQPLAL